MMLKPILIRWFLILLFGSQAYVFSAQAIEVVHEFDAQTPPGNIAVSENGRVFMSTHFFYGAQYKLVEVLGNGKTAAYPNAEFSQSINAVLGIIVDRKGTLWILETADEKTGVGRLIGWDTHSNKLKRVVYIAPPSISAGSFLNDLAVDTTNNAVYITDTASPKTAALIVVDLSTGQVRRVLENSEFTRPEDIAMIIDDREITLGQEGARIGVNPITIDAQDQWVYFAPMSGLKLYRVNTKDLLNEALSSNELGAKVEVYAEKPMSDGITIDNDNNIYITDITAAAVGVVRPTKEYTVLQQNSETLSWPDGFANGPDDYIYVTVNKLHKSPALNSGKNESGGRYYIVRFKALATLSTGR